MGVQEKELPQDPTNMNVSSEEQFKRIIEAARRFNEKAEKEKKQAVDCLTRLDPDLLSFLYSFKNLDNDSENVWFVGLDTQTDNLCSDENLVIMESYVIEDSTISVVLQGENKGKFVYCNEGIYEDAEIIADDFFSFLQLHAYCVELGKDTVKNNPLWAFV